MNEKNPLNSNLPLDIKVIVCKRHDGMPSIELRRHISEPEVVKDVIRCMLEAKGLVVVPMFTNPIKGMASLLEKGILYKNDDDNQYYFTF